MPEEDNCVFCRIARKELPSRIVYEDADFLAFLDKFPKTPGHLQVIPKKHYRWVFDCPKIGGYFEAVKKVSDAAKKSLNADSITLFVSGYEIPHAHVWIIPRYPNDGHGGALDFSITAKLSDSEISEIADKIRKTLK